MNAARTLAFLALILAVPLPALAVLPLEAPPTARVVDLPQWGVTFASWEAAGPEGVERRVAVSKDGGATWSDPTTMRFEIPLRAGLLVPGISNPELPGGLQAGIDNRLFIVQFETKGLEAWRAALRAKGAEPLWYLPRHAWIARMGPAVAAEVAALPFVRWVGPYHPGYKIEPEVLEEIAHARASYLPKRYHLMTFTPGPTEKALLAEEVVAAGGRVVLEIPSGYRFDAELTHEQLVRISRSAHLAWLDRWSPPENDMDVVRAVSGANDVESVAGYSGQGVRGEVMDAGVEQTHQDFDGIQIHGPGSGVDSHGTSTYGIVFGNGNRDGDGQARGLGHLPSREAGYFYDYFNLIDRYQVTAELVQPPIQAVFQSNSWGDARTRAYTSISQEMDDIIWINDIAIFQSQSNAGNQDSRPQAWSKNIISIGAVEHYDTSALGDDCWCFSGSIGPAADGRIKPDLSYWYDWIYTTTTGNSYTSGFGGTSAATPVTAGIGGLIFQMWADNVLGNNPQGASVFEKRPHAMTLKALMIATAEQYPFTGTGADLTRVHQGWGLASAKNFYDRRALIKVVDEENLLQELDTHVYTAMVPAAQNALKITMSYMDRAGTTSSVVHRINDVSLKVTDPTGTVTFHGNVGLNAGNWSVAGGVPNAIDTVENVFVQNPAAGAWTIEISADDINLDVHQETPEVDQDYALVVNGASDLTFGCLVPPTPPSGLAATANGDNRIDLAWSGPASSRGYKVYRSSSGCGGAFSFLANVPASQTSFSDAAVSGGLTYAYQVKSLEGCESEPTACASAEALGPCILTPAFAGLASASSQNGEGCGIELAWPPATPACGGPVLYNVYRATSAGFTPGPSNRVASCVSGSPYVDTRDLVANTTYHYVVRAEDTGGRGAATCNGSAESNATVRSAKVQGPQGNLMSTGFESGLEGWTVQAGSPAATRGMWLADVPVGSDENGQQANPASCAAGTRCLFTEKNKGGNPDNGDVDDGGVVALSPVFDASAYATARLTLSRWHYNSSTSNDNGDLFALDVSSDGGTGWTNLESLGSRVSVNAWTPVAFDLETRTALTGQMRLRVRSTDGTNFSTILESAVDAVAVQGAQLCSTQPSSAPGGVGASSLAVDKDASKVRLSWSPDCGGATGYGIYRGELSAGYASAAPLPGYCGVGGTTASIDPGPGSYFYLVAPNQGSVEGSLGRDGAGVERAQPGSACWPRAVPVNACAP